MESICRDVLTARIISKLPIVTIIFFIAVFVVTFGDYFNVKFARQNLLHLLYLFDGVI